MGLFDEIAGDLKKRKGAKGTPAAGDDEDEPVDEMDTEPADEGGDEDTAVQELMDAIKADDVGGAKAALKSFIKICYPNLGE